MCYWLAVSAGARPHGPEQPGAVLALPDAAPVQAAVPVQRDVVQVQQAVVQVLLDAVQVLHVVAGVLDVVL